MKGALMPGIDGQSRRSHTRRSTMSKISGAGARDIGTDSSEGADEVGGAGTGNGQGVKPGGNTTAQHNGAGGNPSVASDTHGATVAANNGLAQDPLSDIKKDPDYQYNEQLVDALQQLANGGFSAIDDKFWGVFDLLKDGCLSQDTINVAAERKDSADPAEQKAILMARLIRDTPGLFHMLDTNNGTMGSNNWVSSNSIQVVYDQLKGKKAEMETAARAAFAAAHPQSPPQNVPQVGASSTPAAGGTGTPNTTPPVTGGAATAGADGAGNVASSANAAGAKVYTNEQILSVMNRLKDGGYESIDHQGVGDEAGNKDGLIAWPDVVKAAEQGNALAKELIAHPEIWEKMCTAGGTKKNDGLVRTADIGEAVKALTLSARADVRAEMAQETPKPTPSTLGGLEGAQENMNNLLGWADTEMERLSGLYAKTSDPAAQKEIENKMNALTRKMQQISNMMNQIMSMISNISKMWSDISMNAIRNMK
jgi:hypothetical protein